MKVKECTTCQRTNYHDTTSHNVFLPRLELRQSRDIQAAKLRVHLCGSQITHGVKQCTTCQRTNYHDTTNHNKFLPRLELLQSRDIQAANLCVPKYCILLIQPIIFFFHLLTYVSSADGRADRKRENGEKDVMKERERKRREYE